MSFFDILIDTGENTMTGGRLKKVFQYLDNETFCFTYGDGLSNVNIQELVKTHKKYKKQSTVTGLFNVRAPSPSRRISCFG